MTDTHYCPQCGVNQPTFKLVQTRCLVCGFPVEQQLPELHPAIDESVPPVVLHIDDDPVSRRLVAGMLKRGGFTPLSAEGGEAGLEIARREHPAAVLLDVMMPRLNGYEVCRRLRANPELKGIAIVMLTASPDPQLDTHAFKAGADLAIRKPFDEEKLLSILRTAVRLKKN